MLRLVKRPALRLPARWCTTGANTDHSLTERLKAAHGERELGFHWHFWHVVLACVPGAAVAFGASFVEPDPDFVWTPNNRALQGRLQELEDAVKGAGADEDSAPELQARVAELEAELAALKARIGEPPQAAPPKPASE